MFTYGASLCFANITAKRNTKIDGMGPFKIKYFEYNLTSPSYLYNNSYRNICSTDLKTIKTISNSTKKMSI